MPHCIVEYSSDLVNKLSAKEMIVATFQGAINSALFEAEQIKVRTCAYDDFQVGTGDNKFIHVSAKILSGRTLIQRQLLAQQILQSFAQYQLSNISITVDVIEMEREPYAKQNN
jgi:5-carboxymethyl-2-hydroxymuconate isomerase